MSGGSSSGGVVTIVELDAATAAEAASVGAQYDCRHFCIFTSLSRWSQHYNAWAVRTSVCQCVLVCARALQNCARARQTETEKESVQEEEGAGDRQKETETDNERVKLQPILMMLEGNCCKR